MVGLVPVDHLYWHGSLAHCRAKALQSFAAIRDEFLWANGRRLNYRVGKIHLFLQVSGPRTCCVSSWACYSRKQSTWVL